MASVLLGTHADTAMQELHGPACLQACGLFYVNLAQQCMFELKHDTYLAHDELDSDLLLSSFYIIGPP